jgi:hypothetical protein
MGSPTQSQTQVFLGANMHRQTNKRTNRQTDKEMNKRTDKILKQKPIKRDAEKHIENI